MAKMIKLILVILLVFVLAVIVRHYIVELEPARFELYGNVDQRQVELAFIDSERVESVFVEEGDIVEEGQILARLETRRLRDRIKSLESQLDISKVVLTRLKNGTRPEEIDQAKADVSAAKVQVEYAERQYERYAHLWEGGKNSISEKDVDEKRTLLHVARETLNKAEKALELAIQGPRREDVEEAEARVALNENQLTELNNQLADADLKSPGKGVVRRRLLEPGDMASPQTAVLSLSIISPKWVRAYVSEKDLGIITPGMKAIIYTDSHPDEGVEGTLGFISSVAEFTPKTVQTPDLRTSLVYEVRIYVRDHDDRLRLGMPATVVFPNLNGQQE